MKQIKIIVAVPVAVNDFLLDVARQNRRDEKGPRSKEDIINEIVKEFYINNTK
jgi:hypothetical protein